MRRRTKRWVGPSPAGRVTLSFWRVPSLLMGVGALTPVVDHSAAFRVSLHSTV